MIDLPSFFTAFAGTTCAFILIALAATRIRHAYLRIGRNYTQLNPIRRQAPCRLVGTHRRYTRPYRDDEDTITIEGSVFHVYRITPKWTRLHRN